MIEKVGVSGSSDQYAALGVQSDKSGVRKTFEGGIDNDFPGAFVNIIRHPMFPGYVTTLHGDGDGSKMILRVLMYLLTGNPKWLEGFADDALSMNLSDIAAAGFVPPDCFVKVIDLLNVNAFNVDKGALLGAIKRGFERLFELYRYHGFTFRFLGGETADLPRQEQTAAGDVAVDAVMREEGVVAGNVRPGDRIWGFASAGQAVWETESNSGIQSNGLTHAVDTLVWSGYAREFPQVLPHGEEFHGRYQIDDVVDGVGSVFEALLSPTRQWSLLIDILIGKLKAAGVFHLLHGISLNSGGGATKVKNVGVGGIVYQKRMPEPAPIFRLIQSESGEQWMHMFRSYNCGVGVDVIGELALAPYLKETERETGVRLYELGECAACDGENRVVLTTDYGTFGY